MRLLLAATVAAVALLALPTAGFGQSSEITGQCSAEGTITGEFSLGDLRYTIRRLPTDMDEYGDCRYVIEQAMAQQYPQAARRFAAIRRVTTSHRGRRMHFHLTLPPCRTAEAGTLRFELVALRPERGRMIVRARSQCLPWFSKFDGMRNARLFPGWARVTVRLAARQRRTSRYAVRLSVGRLVVDRLRLVRRTTRSGAFRLTPARPAA